MKWRHINEARKCAEEVLMLIEKEWKFVKTLKKKDIHYIDILISRLEEIEDEINIYIKKVLKNLELHKKEMLTNVDFIKRHYTRR